MARGGRRANSGGKREGAGRKRGVLTKVNTARVERAVAQGKKLLLTFFYFRWRISARFKHLA
jgi:hypothetical protein